MRPLQTPLLIGLDVGTTAVKATLFDAKGQALKSVNSPYPVHRSAPDIVEQDPSDWMTLVLRALGDLTAGLKREDISGVGLCSQVNTHVFVGDNGEALMPAITWQDGRCGEEAARLDALVPLERRIAWWGAPLPIDASHVLARAAWVARHRPDVWSRTRFIMAPKDYCILQLTGVAAADPMASFGVIDQDLHYVDELLALVPGAAERMPPLADLTEKLGPILPGRPGSGLPMVTGTMDAWSSLFGCGVLARGDAMYLSGTSEVLGIVSETRVPTPGVIAFPRCEGITLHAGPTQAGGASIAWLSRLLGRTPAELSELVAAADPHRPTPVFLPHLQGERAPVWDIGARGSFSGLDGAMEAADLARAVFEGVAYSVRWLMQSLEQSADCRPALLTLSGGGAASDIWCQIRADVLGRPVRRLKTLDAGVMGAALLAGVGAGQFPSIDAAARTLVTTDRLFEPDPGRAARHDFGFARYLELYEALKPFNAAFTGFRAW